MLRNVVDNTAASAATGRDEHRTRLTNAVDAYQSLLLRYAVSLMGSRHDDAQDVVQNVFIRLHRHAEKHGWNSIDNLHAWLLRVTHNLVMDAGRRSTRDKRVQERVMDDPVAAEFQASGDGGDVSESVARRELMDVAQRELNRLPDEQKTVLRLKLAENLTLREISEITDLKIGTVNYRLTQGLTTLAAKLKSLNATGSD